MDLLNAKETVALRVNKSFFETAGYTAELEMFHGKFDPTKQWICKKRGELRVKFEGDEKSVSTTLKDLLAHGLNVVCLTQQFAFSDDEDDEDEPVAVKVRLVGFPLLGGPGTLALSTPISADLDGPEVPYRSYKTTATPPEI